MGLTNGVILKTKTSINLKNIPAYVKIEDVTRYYTEEKIFVYEICYWRNCWTTRTEILNNCPNIEKENSKSELNRENIEVIQDILANYLKNPDTWNEGRSIWDFDEMVETLAQQVVNLGWLKQYMSDKSNQHWRVEFYNLY